MSGEPLIISSQTPKQVKYTLESWGFVLYPDEDPLYPDLYLELPPGWRKVPILSDGTPFYQILDDKGRIRATAGTCDEVHLCTRYNAEAHHNQNQTAYWGVATDHMSPGQMHRTNDFLVEERADDDEKKEVVARCLDLARKWLDEKYPKWRSPRSYWDEP